MAESFRRVQMAVDEDMDQDGSEMCHILKMLAMAIFSRHNDPTISSSPEEKLTVVADLVSAELQEQMKHHKAAMMDGAIGKGIVTASGENVEEEQQQRQQQREEVEEEEEEEPGVALVITRGILEQPGNRGSYFDMQLTKREYAARRKSLLTAEMSNQKRIQQLESEARRQQKLHEQCHLDLNRKNRLIKELRLRIPGQGLGAWLNAPPKQQQLVFPQTTRSRILRETKESMSLRVGAHPLKLQWLARQVYDAFGHATNGEARAA